MKIANKFIEKILSNNAIIADLATSFDRSLERTKVIIESNEKNSKLTTEAALRIIEFHTSATRNDILVEA